MAKLRLELIDLALVLLERVEVLSLEVFHLLLEVHHQRLLRNASSLLTSTLRLIVILQGNKASLHLEVADSLAPLLLLVQRSGLLLPELRSLVGETQLFTGRHSRDLTGDLGGRGDGLGGAIARVRVGSGLRVGGPEGSEGRLLGRAHRRVHF